MKTADRKNQLKLRIAWFVSAATLAISFLWVGLSLGISAQSKEFTTDFRIEECDFSDRGRNAYFSLNPGDFLHLSDGTESVEIKVLDETKTITFKTKKGKQLNVKTRVVEEIHIEDGKVVERSRNFFARCKERNDIFYFGEDVFPTSIGGVWLAGKNGALPGIIMPGTFLLGSRYFQEIAPGVALDRAEHAKMGLTITVPTAPQKTFKDCVEVFETTPLEPGSSVKRYCPGVGLVFDSGLKLIEFHITKADDDDDD